MLNCWLELTKPSVGNGCMSYITLEWWGRYLLTHTAWRAKVTLAIKAISSLNKEEIIFGSSSATCVYALFNM